MRRILIIEPYYGGSHKHFLQGLQSSVVADYTLISLPPRKWKMRMQLAAPWVVQQIKAMPRKKRWFDTLLCSTFVDVALLRTLLDKVDGWNGAARVNLYFHENQFAYPTRRKEPAYYQFSSINFTSALAADSLAFNSAFNRDSFISGCRRYLKLAADMPCHGLIQDLLAKSRILYPGLDFSCCDSTAHPSPEPLPVIVWNHRWEHDKNPEEFFRALNILKQKNSTFRLLLMGQSFRTNPECFTEAIRDLATEIIHAGFVESYEDYVQLLKRGTVVVSTALHEFFGIAVIEAVRAGCVPLLPDRLSYPELFESRYLYSDGQLVMQLEKILAENNRLSLEQARDMTQRFSWPALHNDYKMWLGVE